METQTPLRQPEPYVAKGYQSLPPELDETSSRIKSAGFVIFAVLTIGGAAAAGALKSGKVSLNQFLPKTKAAVAASAPAVPAAKAATPVHPPASSKRKTAAPTVPSVHAAAPVPMPKPGDFVVTTIALGQPSYAIINGASHGVGDAVTAPGVTGWTVNRILDGAVWLQNGSSLVAIPLSAPDIKPLDDSLHPLN